MEKKMLAELRESRNMTQRDLAKALNISPGAVAMYELGERTPSLKMAKKIAGLFKVPVEQIFFGDDAREMRTLRKSEDIKRGHKTKLPF